MKCCCFCCTLRQGSYACGVWSLVWGIMEFGYAIYGIATVNHFANPHGNETHSIDVVKDNVVFPRPELLVSLILSACWLISAVVLLVGVSSRHRWMFIPWLLLTGLHAINDVINVILIFVLRVPQVFDWVMVTVTIIMLVGNIYCILCVSYYFKEVPKDKKKRDDIQLDEKKSRTSKQEKTYHPVPEQDPVVIDDSQQHPILDKV